MAASSADAAELLEDSDASYERIPDPQAAWEPEEECNQFQQLLKHHVQGLQVRQPPERLQFLRVGFKTISKAQASEFDKSAKAFFFARCQGKVFRLWVLATRVSGFRRHRMRRAVDSWKLMASVARLRAEMESNFEREEALAYEVQQLKLLRNAVTLVASMAVPLGARYLAKRMREANRSTERRLKSDIEEKAGQQSEKLMEVEQRLEGRIDERASQQDEKLMKTEQRLEDRIDERASQLSEKLKRTEQRLEYTIDKRVGQQNEKLQKSEQRLEDRMAEEESRQSERLKKAERRLGDRVDERVGQQNKKLKRNERQLARIREEADSNSSMLDGRRLRLHTSLGRGWWIDLPSLRRLSKL